MFLAMATLAFTTGTGCGEGDYEVVENEEIVAVDPSLEEPSAVESALTGSFPVGTTLKTTTGLNLRRGAGTGYAILLTMPSGASVTVVTSAPVSGWYNVKYGSTTGWASGAYLVKPSTTTTYPRRSIVGHWVRAHVQAFANAACYTHGCPYEVGSRVGHDPSGDRAIDMMMAIYGTRPTDGGARGDRIGQFALGNWSKYKVMYVIWKQRINSNDGRGWRWMADRGSITQNHYDHVHVSFNP